MALVVGVLLAIAVGLFATFTGLDRDRAFAGFKSSLWVVAIALAAHGGFDLIHGRLISNPGMPAWWPAFCGMYDLTAAAYLAALIRFRRQPFSRGVRFAPV